MQNSDVYFLAERALETLVEVSESIARALEINSDHYANDLLTVAQTNITIAKLKLNVVQDISK